MTRREKARGAVLIGSVFLVATTSTLLDIDWLYTGFVIGLIVGVFVGNEQR